MAPDISTTSLHLSYPLYACDFDPQDANRLIVGGGGGPGRSGVSNKISVLDVSDKESIQILSELDLSRDEDSVNTIAVGPRRRNSILLFAGINSSPAEVTKGNNEHFRVFSVDQTSKAKATPKITELSRSSLFSYKETDAYQRVLRLSQHYTDKPQIGAIASGLAKDAEIAVFDVPATGNTPKPRGKLELAKDAVDVDIIQTGDSDWQIVYCDNYEIFTFSIGKKGTEGPNLVFTVPHDESPRPSFRSLRYLTPTFLLATANIPQAGGVVLQGFRLPKPDQGSEAKARLAISSKLPKTITRSIGMAVRNLSPPSTPTTKYGDTQFIIAVAGHDSSVTVYKVDHQAVGEIELLANLHFITTFKDVHPGPISGLVFSHFIPPKTATMRQHYIKLASIGSMGNSLVIHSLPLKRITEKVPASARRAGPPRQPRYVIALKAHGPSPRSLVMMLTAIVLIMAIIGQSILEVKGISPSIIGARRVLPKSWHEDWPRKSPLKEGFLSEFLAEKKLGADDKVVVLEADPQGDGAGGVKVDMHDEETHDKAVEWHELPTEQKNAWKEKLKAAGQWGEHLGEAVFKGVLFGEIGGLVGQVVREL